MFPWRMEKIKSKQKGQPAAADEPAPPADHEQVTLGNTSKSILFLCLAHQQSINRHCSWKYFRYNASGGCVVGVMYTECLPHSSSALWYIKENFLKLHKCYLQFVRSSNWRVCFNNKIRCYSKALFIEKCTKNKWNEANLSHLGFLSVLPSKGRKAAAKLVDLFSRWWWEGKERCRKMVEALGVSAWRWAATSHSVDAAQCCHSEAALD